MAAAITWILAEKAYLIPFAVAVIDFAIAMNPNLSGNGVLHSVYVFLVGQEAPKA